ncbi:hypothetical protein [Flavobacterium sp.]|uniref:hypothetical protein n=1 Tax=Flavobacterium sp. TaxID=239 RepID=UPI002615E7DC|nr:hypothetical protein [Flavobacterium sp.]
MTTLKEIERKNRLVEKDFGDITEILFKSFLINRTYKKISSLEKKEELVLNFTDFLEKYLEFDIVSSKQNKLSIINFIDKLNLQRELLEVEKGNINLTELKVVSKRFGKKAQSSFEKQ